MFRIILKHNQYRNFARTEYISSNSENYVILFKLTARFILSLVVNLWGNTSQRVRKEVGKCDQRQLI